VIANSLIVGFQRIERSATSVKLADLRSSRLARRRGGKSSGSGIESFGARSMARAAVESELTVLKAMQYTREPAVVPLGGGG